MASENGTFFSAYPGIMSQGGNDDDSFRAALTSHAGASVERNQDSQFAALRSQLVQSEVGYNREATLQAKYDSVVAQKDAEIRQSERFAGIEKELAVIRAEALSRDVSALSRELADVKAGRSSDALSATLAAILAKVS